MRAPRSGGPQSVSRHKQGAADAGEIDGRQGCPVYAGNHDREQQRERGTRQRELRARGSSDGRNLRIAGCRHMAATPPTRSKATNRITASC